MRSRQGRGLARPYGSEVRGAVVEIAVAGGLVYLAAYATLDPPGPAFGGPVWVAWLAAVAVGLPVAARRRWPLPVVGWVTVAAAVATASGVVGTGVIWVAYLPVALALYPAATTAGPAVAGVALAGGLAAPAVTIPWLYNRAGIDPADAPGSEAPLWWQVELGMVAVMVTAAWAVGRVVRWRRMVQADAARRLARDAVAAERLRIARELHDIVGHSMSLIAVKATVANHLAAPRPASLADPPGPARPGGQSHLGGPADPEDALATTRAALETIERTSRAALTEIRRLLDVLRAETEPAAGSDPSAPDVELGPSPGTADLAELAERLGSAGLRVELRLDVADDLPAGVDLAVFRVVQEALTNVVKHANAGHCQVTVRARDGGVHIEVRDDGRARRPSGRRPAGQGLIGMRERVAMYGGTLTTGRRPEGGFEVVADIPYASAEAA